MRQIVYYVAISLDGYISGPNDPMEGYVSEGSGLNQYMEDLKAFDTVIMGKNTYELGFRFGIEPGQLAYPHMEHYVFSESASYPTTHPKMHVVPRDLSIIKELREQDGSDIYLCGGSVFAGWLLNNKLIDVLKVKQSPVIFGAGLPLFSNVERFVKLEMTDMQQHDHGMMIKTFKMDY